MELHATVLGEGPPVCLLHGLFGRSQNLLALAKHLSGQARVLSLDLRNHGASAHAAGMSYAAMAQDVLTTLAAHDALPATVLGHSMGGKVAMVLALTAPAQVRRLIVADIAPVTYLHANQAVARAMQGLALHPDLNRRQADAALSAGVPDAGVRGFLLQNLMFGAAPAWRIGLDHIAAGMEDIQGWPTLPPGARYDGPTLFITGDRSEYVLPAHWDAITPLFPRARLVRLADAGHWLHADQPVAFAAAVDAFLT